MSFNSKCKYRNKLHIIHSNETIEDKCAAWFRIFKSNTPPPSTETNYLAHLLVIPWFLLTMSLVLSGVVRFHFFPPTHTEPSVEYLRLYFWLAPNWTAICLKKGTNKFLAAFCVKVTVFQTIYIMLSSGLLINILLFAMRFIIIAWTCRGNCTPPIPPGARRVFAECCPPSVSADSSLSVRRVSADTHGGQHLVNTCQALNRIGGAALCSPSCNITRMHACVCIQCGPV